ncbi:O-succinylbenzoic acid--CoA ligase [Puteibacter caeruleilacunae]|nr:O-succinylbenzoic acid--CoA ligase [Puteibacter caeruleilacunae]
MNSDFSTVFKINGQEVALSNLADHCTGIINTTVQDWEKQLYGFILEFINPEPYIVVQTSGSTSVPKEISIEKQKMIASARMTLAFLDLKSNDRALLCLPVTYIAGKMMVVRALVGGLHLIATESTGTPALGEVKEVEFAAMVPMQVHNLMKTAAGRSILDGIKKLIIGGGPVDQKQERQLNDRLCEAFSTYGMTETLSHIAMRRLNGAGKSDYYSILPGIEIGQTEESCLTIDAPHLVEEKLITNDVVELLSKEQFKIIGRKDNIINSGGVKVMPEKLEKQIGQFISSGFVLSSIPDDRLGERLVLVIEGEPLPNEREEKLIELLRGILNKYEMPRKICYLRQLPEVGNNKIDRKEIKRLIK